MSNVSWNAQTDWATVCRRAAGRRRYNSERTTQRAIRQLEVQELLGLYGLKDGLEKRGTQARIARQLQVSEATISRDVKMLREEYLLTPKINCPMCDSVVDPGRIKPIFHADDAP